MTAVVDKVIRFNLQPLAPLHALLRTGGYITSGPFEKGSLTNNDEGAYWRLYRGPPGRGAEEVGEVYQFDISTGTYEPQEGMFSHVVVKYRFKDGDRKGNVDTALSLVRLLKEYTIPYLEEPSKEALWEEIHRFKERKKDMLEVLR